MNTEYETAIIVGDSDDEPQEPLIKESNQETSKPETSKPETSKPEKPKKHMNKLLNRFYNNDETIFEMGVDEAGRGPLFGRVYTAGVILPKDDSFDHSRIKDSKKFHSKKKIEEVAEYIKTNAIAWYVSFEDEKKIDSVNILQATQLSMHTSILELKKQIHNKMTERNKEENVDYSYLLLIDGNYFNPISYMNKKTNKFEQMNHICVEGGDDKYTSIAAASILAKVERDKYIDELCKENPLLIQYYGIDSNKGYGAKKHIDGIKEHGITIWHRRSFGICKQFA